MCSLPEIYLKQKETEVLKAKYWKNVCNAKQSYYSYTNIARKEALLEVVNIL